MDAFGEICREFQNLTGIPLDERKTNRLEDRVMRLDSLFAALAARIFDEPKLLPRLLIRYRQWRRKCNNETIWSLGGYLHYIEESYGEAVQCFFEALTRNPENLDNWLDLGYALHHLESKFAHPVLFNFDLFLKYYKEMNFKRCHYFTLEKIWNEILEEKKEYSRTYIEYLPPAVDETI